MAAFRHASQGVTVRNFWLCNQSTLPPLPPSRFFYHPDSGWSRDQPQPGSFSQRQREAEEREPGNEVDKFLLSRGRKRSFLPSKWRTKLLLTGSHEVVSRKVRNGLKRKTSRYKDFSKRRTPKIFYYVC